MSAISSPEPVILSAQMPLAGPGPGSSTVDDLERQVVGLDVVHRDRDDDEKVTVPAVKSMAWLDRFLALWICLAMAVGIMLGNFVPSTGPALQRGKIAGVSVPIAIGLFVMMYPILCNVRYESLHRILARRSIWGQVLFSLVINCIVAPFFMLGLAWAFLPDKSELRTGLILVGLGRCIAMVLIWNGLAGGDDEYCAILVAINSILQTVLFAPLAVLFIRVLGAETVVAHISYELVATSVAVFLGIPLAAAIMTRLALRTTAGTAWYDRVFLPCAAPWSLAGLLYTVIVLFASQGRQVVHQIVSVVRVAAPLVVYFISIFCSTLFITYRLGFGYPLAVTQSFTASSNNFELAIAVAVAAFGPDSDQALASTVGPLIEVPVLVGLVHLVRFTRKRWDWRE
ncbi:hypothetical protein RJ55_04225 [Drechmeria coniospora]|nr:hypothetical protein RJ55_04225 [Drechmeria coniospora]